jgi:hypothetical protein
MEDPGTAKTSKIAEHWDVCLPTARAVIKVAGLIPVSGCPRKYHWSDIWRLEGEAHVPRGLWSAFKEPLLKVPHLPAFDEKDRSARTWRRHVECNRLPVIRLTDDISRVRKCVFETAQHYI